MRVVCRACYAPAPPGTKPWQAFVCACYVPGPKTRLGKKLAALNKKQGKKEEE